MNQLLAEKRALGFKYNDEAYFFTQLDRYWAAKNYPDDCITKERLGDWLVKRSTESNRSHSHRIDVTRQLTKYMAANNCTAYVPENNIHYNKPAIRILTKEEIQELFREIDAYTCRSSINYSLLFRLILCLGLRSSEARYLTADNFDFERNCVAILNGKANKDRLVYFGDELAEMCKAHIASLSQDNTRRWLFPSATSKDQPVSIGTVGNVMRMAVRKTAIPDNSSLLPTVHTLRHNFVVMRILSWTEQGLNINLMMPYLSRHLGHNSAEETYYYYHQVIESLKLMRSSDKTTDDIIPEVRDI